MKHYLSISIISLAVATALPAVAHSLKKDYCANQDFYTNTGADESSTYPHLHCGKAWITYSASSTQHYNLFNKGGFADGTAKSACFKAQEQGAANLRTIIGNVCTDYTNTGCAPEC